MQKNRQQGATSIFIVVFFTLLVVVLTIGFIRIMVREQQAAMNNDLSQSAYDSAITGVEDAKRAVRECQQNPGGDACNAINAGKCDTIQRAKIVSEGGSETVIRSQQGTDGNSLNQAYTCVIIKMNTEDYLTNITEGQSVLVSLTASDSFKYIEIEWMRKNNNASGMTYLGGEPDSLSPPVSSAGTGKELPQKSAWNESAPSLLRVQAVLPEDRDNLSFDALDTDVVSTYFLRPLGVNGSADSSIVVSPSGRAAKNNATITTEPIAVNCSNDRYQNGQYACKAVIDMRDKSVPAGSTVAMLRLTSLYRDTSARVTLKKTLDSNPVDFSGVQPSVDSTGRAGDIFRRVSSRLDLGANDFPIPENAVDLTGSLCKNFYVTSRTTSNSSTSGANTPACKPSL